MENQQSDVIDRDAVCMSFQRQQESSEVDRWMAILAHELREPLNAIVMALDAIEPVHPRAPEDLIPEDVARVAACQMRRIIDDVLDLCRHRRGQVQSHTQSIDLAEAIVAAVNSARPMIASKGHRLAVSMPRGQVMLEAHPSRIERVLTNLLTNAAKYTEHGGRITLAVEPAIGAVVIRVRDNGIGIPASFLPYVFDCYRRGSNAQSEAVGGLGIGLALVKSLVELHGGTVSVFSDGSGKGSEFAVHLPRGVL